MAGGTDEQAEFHFWHRKTSWRMGVGECDVGSTIRRNAGFWQGGEGR
ncbi:MAG: hypothetical protein ACKVHX_14590 [Alphaproteobacteria bacterium]